MIDRCTGQKSTGPSVPTPTTTAAPDAEETIQPTAEQQQLNADTAKAEKEAMKARAEAAVRRFFFFIKKKPTCLFKYLFFGFI